MRRLMSQPVVLRALVAGNLVAGAGVPFLLSHSQPGALLVLRLAVLAPLTILLFQIMLAWTPLGDGAEAFPAARPWRSWLGFALAAIGLAAFYRVVVDPGLAAQQPGYYPTTLREWLVSLPWVVFFQPLVLVAAVFAFAARLGGRAVAGIAAVALIRQAAMLYHWHSLPPGPLFLLVLLAGIHGLFAAVAYRRLGYPGLALTTFVLEARFLLALGK